MVGLTLNRFTLILHPSRYPKIYTPISLALQLFGIWAFSFGIMVRYFFNLKKNLVLKRTSSAATSVVRNLGSARPGRGNLLVHHSQEGRQLTKEIHLPIWRPGALHSHFYLLLVHILHCAQAARQSEGTQV